MWLQHVLLIVCVEWDVKPLCNICGYGMYSLLSVLNGTLNPYVTYVIACSVSVWTLCLPLNTKLLGLGIEVIENGSIRKLGYGFLFTFSD